MTLTGYRILLISTPVGPLGSGLGGGVELFVTNAVQALTQRGHHITVLAPEGSVLPVAETLIPFAGSYQPTAHTSDRDSPVIMPEPSVLSAMWDYARQVQDAFDVILHYAYDWLPFYLAPFLRIPVAHYVTMGSLNDGMDHIIAHAAHTIPHSVGLCTQVQAATFPAADRYEIIGCSVDLERYEYCDTPGQDLVWLGRISPEKGLEDAIAAAQMSQMPLKILGKLENEAYWHDLQYRYPDAPIEYLGFFATQEMQAIVRNCRALLMTPKWVEAFGNVAIEALACGVPVIAYRRGGPTEIVQHGKTGWLVEPDSVGGLVEAIHRIDGIDRAACRAHVVANFSIATLGDRLEHWFQTLLNSPEPKSPNSGLHSALS